MKTEDILRGYDINVLLGQILDAKKHNLYNSYIVEKIQCVIVKLIYYNRDVIELIQSEDNETFNLGVQLLFKDYLDQYNQLCENSKWNSLISNMIKCYFDLNG